MIDWDNVLVEDAVSGGFLTGRTIHQEITKAAGLFKAFRLKENDTVSLLLENDINDFIFFGGAKMVSRNIQRLSARSRRYEILNALEFARSKLLVIEERFVWDPDENRPSVLLEELSKQLPQLFVIVVHDERNKIGKEDGAGFCGSYSWTILQEFIEPVSATYSSPHFLRIICGSHSVKKMPASHPEFEWVRNDHGFYVLMSKAEAHKCKT